MTRKTVMNPKTGRYVYKDGILGKKIIEKQKKLSNKKVSRTMKSCKKTMVRTKSSSKQSKPKLGGCRKCSKVTKMKTTTEYGPTKECNDISFLLNISTTKTAPQRGILLNRFEEPDSVIKMITHSEITRYNREIDEHIPLTKRELEAVGFVGEQFILHNTWKNDNNEVVAETKKTFKNQKGYFTIKEIVKHIVNFERVDRPKTSWFGGVDCHHIYYEGIHLNRDKAGYGIGWGS